MKRWKTVPVDERRVAALAAETGLHSALLRVLVGRGYDTAPAIERFNNPRLSELADPFALPDMTRAAERIWAAIDGGERMVVHGDYDADGITSTALLVTVLRELGGDAHWFLPSRMDDGYGLSVDTAEHCARSLKPGLIVTVDCGSGSVEAVEALRALGVDVVVTDHHEVRGAPAPAVAVVNPKLGSDCAARDLAGVGVVFKLCHALVKRGLSEKRPGAPEIDLRRYLDLVAVGTIADVVPLTGENRALARHGLARLNRTESIGLRSLIAAAGVERELDTYHVGFVLGPRLNAAGRLGSANASLQLLLTRDPAEADRLARELNAANADRKRIEDTIRMEAEADLSATFDSAKDFGLVAARKGWHPGTIGIVASRLVGRYGRPAIVIALDDDGTGRGSCRSTEALDMLAALEDCRDLLTAFGGHHMAAGLSIAAGKVDAFRRRFNEACAARMRGQDLTPVQTVDAWLTLGDANGNLWKGLQGLRPFGTGHATPVWGVRGVRAVSTPRRVGKDGAHLSLTLGDGTTRLGAIGFNLGGMEVPTDGMDVLFHLEENTFKGQTELRLKVQDFAPAGARTG